jgi:hypothetical protein
VLSAETARASPRDWETLSPADIDTILRRLEDQNVEFRTFRAEQRADVKQLVTDVREVKSDVKKQNGRVGKLEEGRRMDEVLRKERAEHLAEETAQKAEALVQQREHQTFTRNALIATAGAFGTVLAYSVVHLLGWA